MIEKKHVARPDLRHHADCHGNPDPNPFTMRPPVSNAHNEKEAD
jgi:hypothetical protein